VTRPTTSLPRAFTHPVWWAALLLLALNDHVLKGSGLLPGSWTGKLSDFAGMIVAPPLLALLFGARRRHSAWLASLLVGAGLCAIDLSHSASQLLEHLLAAVGLPSRLWPDPSDLWALLALPIGYALSQVPADRAALRSPRALLASSWLPRAAIALGAFACLATAGIDEKEGGDDKRTDLPEVENATDTPIAVVLSATDGIGGCALYRNDRIGVLTRSAFGEARVVTIDAGKRVPLTAVSKDALDCGAAALRLPDGSDEFVFWRDLTTIESFVGPDDDRRLKRRVVISGSKDRFDIEIGEELARFDIDKEPPVPSCDPIATEPTLEWSPLADAQGFFRLSEIRTSDDGCFELDWLSPHADTEVDTQRLCVPDWAFPFEQDEVLAITQEVDEDGARVLHIGRIDDDKLKTELVVWNGVSKAGNSRVDAIQPIDCVGEVSACGAYVRPVELKVHGRDETLRVGDEGDVKGDGAKTTRVLAGIGRDVGWPAPDCQGDEALVGTRASFLELRTY
jgi:hypothetical protein